MDLQKSYLKRRDVLQNWLSNATNLVLKEKCDLALSLTDHAMETFVSIKDVIKLEQDGYQKYFDTIMDSIKTRSTAHRNEVDKIRKLLETETDELGRDNHINLLRSLNITAIGIQSSIDLLRFDERHRNIYWRSIENMEETLANKIFAPEWKEFSIDAVMKAFEFGIGLIPVIGTIADATSKIADLITRTDTRHNTADEHLNYLDDYCNAVMRWCSTMENIKKKFQELTNSYSQELT